MTSVSSAVAFKIVLQKERLLILKSQVLACLWGKLETAAAAVLVSLGRWLQVLLVDDRNDL